jgi:DNA-binding HxlR family transcriptional regulator
VLEFIYKKISMTSPTPQQKSSRNECPVQKLARIISDPWTILILRDLLISPKRFCELEKSLTGISTRTLTLKLLKLSEEEVISHDSHYYSMTKKGQKLKTILAEIEKVGKKF